LLAGRMQAAWREVGDRVDAGVRDFVRNESGMVTPQEMRGFLDGVDELREAVDRLGARLDRLQHKSP
jgi:ubiquinone biosynthesis protein UbiJ